MAKRYHQSKAARKREHMGMERYERGPVLRKNQPRFNDSDHADQNRESMPFHDGVSRRDFMGEYYAGMDARRRQELEDAGMIHEDHRAIANLPQEVMIKPYPKPGRYMPEGIDDTIRGVDAQIDFDEDKVEEHFYPKKV